ncbi:centromere protein Scm3-domain-containing protein [Chytriomyces cf. hyalinus JEL632]|nr:centromere protein Scm3-domain-containing protein [Chytriomyces cf. hyalinus JEL632]
MGTSDKRPTNVSTCTTPTTTAAKKGAGRINVNKNSGSSHGKKAVSESTGIAASTTKNEKDVKTLRAQAEARLMNTWSSIFEKYGRDLSAESDEIDVRTGEIVVDNGFHRNCKYVPFGRALYDADDADEDEDEDDEDEEEEEDEEYDEEEIENNENCESRAAAAPGAATDATTKTAKTAGKLIENGDHSERPGSANMLSAISKRKNLMTSHAPISFEELCIPQTPSQGSFQKTGVKTVSATTPTPISTAAFKKSMKTPSVKSTTKSSTEFSTPPHQEPRTPNGPSKTASNEQVSDSFEGSQKQTPVAQIIQSPVTRRSWSAKIKLPIPQDSQPSITSSAVSAPKVDCTPSGVGDRGKDHGKLTAVRKCVSTKKPAPRNRLGSSVIGKLQKNSKDAVTLMSSPLGKHSFVVIEDVLGIP